MRINGRDTNAWIQPTVPTLARDRSVDPCALAHSGIARATPYSICKGLRFVTSPEFIHIWRRTR